MKQIYDKLLVVIQNNYDDFIRLVNADNTLGLNTTPEEIIDFLEFASDDLEVGEITSNIIITEGDILSILKVIGILTSYSGNYIIYINEDNINTNTFFIRIANMLYFKLGVNIKLKVDYSKNYNDYLEEKVMLIGSKNFASYAHDDFREVNEIIV